MKGFTALKVAGIGLCALGTVCSGVGKVGEAVPLLKELGILKSDDVVEDIIDGTGEIVKES